MILRSIVLTLMMTLFSHGLPGEERGCDWGHGQKEVTMTPETFVIETTQAGQPSLGITAVNRLNSPAVNGQKLANTLLTDAALTFHPEGFAFFSYRDRFSRHFRGRKQKLVRVDDQLYMEDLLNLPGGYAKPKVLLDLYKGDLDALAFVGSDDILWWNGDLIYKFDFGFPVTALSLSDVEGKLKTRVGDLDAAVGKVVEVSLSDDGKNWYTAWRSPFQGGGIDVDAELPPALIGKKTIYLRFRGRETALLDLYVSARLDTKNITPLLRVLPGRNAYRFTDEKDSSHHAIFFWEGPGVYQKKEPGELITYPGSLPQVTENDGSITILFPERVGIILGKEKGKGTGKKRLLGNQKFSN